jgi:succinate dehydrogenase/fumarate reductase flavoprotein subunit
MTAGVAGGAVDLLVVGGGGAGLTVAAREGAKVVLVERAPELGGNLLLARYLWTLRSFDELKAGNPDGDPDLGRALIDGFDEGVEWIRSVGCEIGPEVRVLRNGRGRAFDSNGYVAACERILREAGAEVIKSAETNSLIVESGVVRGAEVVLADGTVRRIEARWTGMMTGGFQANPELRAKYVHPQARDIPLRSRPYSDGGGLRLGLSAGGAFGKSDAGLYGHLVPAGVPLTDRSLFREIALVYSEHALLFNIMGERFFDETRADNLTADALVTQPAARGLLVCDAATRRDWIDAPYIEGMEIVDSFEACRRRGARCAVAEDIEEFALIP